MGMRADLAAAQKEFAGVHAAFDVTQLPPAASRAAYAAGAAYWNSGAPAMASQTDFSIGAVPARLYRPTGREQRAILYLHGGGFLMGSIASHDALMRRLAVAADAAVLGIDYRLAPEYPFPAALEDCLAAWIWLRGALPGVPAMIAGDSAGACLSVSTALRLRGGDAPAALGLFYGCFTSREESASHARFGDGTFGLSTPQMRFFWNAYLGGRVDAVATPLDAELRGLPPSLLLAAGLDPLLDDSRAMAAALSAAGVANTLRVWRGVNHGFLRLGSHVVASRAAVRAAGCWMRGVA
jgi:acetyl esterase